MLQVSLTFPFSWQENGPFAGRGLVWRGGVAHGVQGECNGGFYLPWSWVWSMIGELGRTDVDAWGGEARRGEEPLGISRSRVMLLFLSHWKNWRVRRTDDYETRLSMCGLAVESVGIALSKLDFHPRQ